MVQECVSDDGRFRVLSSQPLGTPLRLMLHVMLPRAEKRVPGTCPTQFLFDLSHSSHAQILTTAS